MKPSENNIISMTIFVFCLFLQGCESKIDSASVAPKNPKPETYEQFAGKWVFINYWAEWCKPCIKEIPELNAFAEKQKNVIVVGVNYDKISKEEEQEVIKKLDIRFPVTRLNIDVHYGFQVPTALPTTIVINPEGKIHEILQGPQTIETLSKVISH